MAIQEPESYLKQPEPEKSSARLEFSERNPSAAELEKIRRQQIWYRRNRWRTSPSLSEQHQKYLDEVGAYLELPRTTTDALLSIYNSLLDDLIPIVDGPRLFRDHSNGQSSTYLVRAICLVTCKARQAAPFLRLSVDGLTLEPLEFSSKLLTGLDAAVRADLETDRVTKVQILALMHLHNDGLSGVDRSLSHLSQAICEAWSLSLQHQVSGNSDQDQCDLLWWSLRNLDRLNKPITSGAAPFMIDDTDISIKRTTPKKDSYRSQLMEVSLILGDLMVKATKVYKASSTVTVDDCEQFPMLSELTSGTSFEDFYRPHRAYLEIWYHVAAMLSCRYSGPGSAPYKRRLASTDQILKIISPGVDENLPPLPLVPYAVSMSTAVIYRALRDGQREKDVACRDLHLCCNALDALGQRWTSVKGVAKLAKRLWRVTKAGIINGPPNNSSKAVCRSPRTGADTSSSSSADMSLHTTSTPQQLGTESANQEVTIPMPMPIQALDREASGIDASCFQFDMAFCDLFDYGMLDGFRDPATWEFFHMDNREASLGK